MDSILFDKLLKINIENKSEFQNFGAHTDDTFFFVARFTGITQILSPKTCFTHICTFVAIASEHIFMVIEADYMEKISFNTRFTNFFIYTRLTILRTLLTETIFSSFSIIPMIACVAFVFWTGQTVLWAYLTFIAFGISTKLTVSLKVKNGLFIYDTISSYQFETCDTC